MKDISQSPAATVTIRHELRPGDLGAIVALHGTLYAREYAYDLTFEGYVAQTLAHFARPHDTTRERVWIAEAGGSPVGCVGVIQRSATQAQLRWFLVSPELRGQGLGRRLLQEAVHFARNAAYDSVFLETVAGLHKAVQLYQAVGFVKTGEQGALLGGQSVTEQRYELNLRNAVL